MSSPRFLVDENMPVALVKALRQSQPPPDLLCVGESGAPPLGTKDPSLLVAAENAGRVLLTLDRKSMPGHLKAHFAAGHHTAGVALMRRGFTLEEYRDEILLIRGATTADEWIDRIQYLP